MEIIYKAIVGSKLYGIDTPNSDTDVKGVYFRPYHDIVPTKDNYFGIKSLPLDNVVNEHNGLEGKNKVESVLYSVKKFMHLAMKGSPTILEIAFVPFDRLLVNTPISQEIMEYVRSHFITKKALSAYLGYFSDQRVSNCNTPKKKSHAYRIGIQGIDLVLTGKINPVLTGKDLQTTLDIRNEVIKDDDHLHTLLQNINDTLRSLKANNCLPDAPDEAKASEFLVYIHEKYYNSCKFQEYADNAIYDNNDPLSEIPF